MSRIFERPRDGTLGLMLDLPQVSFTSETLGIEFVDILRTGRPRGKPTVLGNYLDAAERNVITRSEGKLCADRLASKFSYADLVGRERL